MERAAKTGHESVAEAMRQINPDVVAAYPITPQTEIVQTFSQFVADGKVDTNFVTVESEHSAMSASVGAAASGARSMTATCANGLALMWEIVYIAASTRLPIVMPVVNRALSGPINIHCDHSDSMGARDSGWIQLYSENAQEAYDNLIQGIRIAEHPDVLLPVMVMLDGFIISHALDTIEMLEDDQVSEFIGEYYPEHSLIDPEKPITVGPLDLYDYFFEHKRQQVEAMKNAKEVILEVGKEYGELTGREYGFFDEYRMDDAELGIVVLSSTAGTAKAAVDRLREEGIKAGMLKIRTFRPSVGDKLVEKLAGLEALAILDRSDTFSTGGGPVYIETKSALFDAGQNMKVVNYIYGLGGRDITVEDIEGVYSDLARIADGEQIEERVKYLGVRE